MATYSGHQNIQPQTAMDTNGSYAVPKQEAISPNSQLSLLQNLNPEKKQTKDGHTPKRRGPKPDSKPALTRRQELNRQAQRTHRERKEMYMKALEQEVLRLKESFSNTLQERDAYAQENQKLKELLASHGIKYDFAANPIIFSRENSGYGPSSSGSISGSYQTATESAASNLSPPHLRATLSNENVPQQHTSRQYPGQLPSNRLDYDQVGIDFVLTLERPCMEHMQYLMVRSANPENQFYHHPLEPEGDDDMEHMSGHALMATAPPHSHVMDKPKEMYKPQMPEGLSTGGLAKLLDLSSRLPLNHDGEITPIMAWTLVLRDPRIATLDAADFQKLKDNLLPKATCYGFGAVIEEFEVRDGLLAILVAKNSAPPTSAGFAVQQQVPVYG